jgi:hypothetical protein
LRFIAGYKEASRSSKLTLENWDISVAGWSTAVFSEKEMEFGVLDLFNGVSV